MKIKPTYAVMWLPKKKDGHKSNREIPCFVSDRGTQVKAFARKENAERFLEKMRAVCPRAEYCLVEVGIKRWL